MYWVPCIIIYDTVLHIIQYTLREEGKRTRDLVKWERNKKVVGSLRALDKTWEHRPLDVQVSVS